jgi:tRNA(Ile)-lysidine synthase
VSRSVTQYLVRHTCHSPPSTILLRFPSSTRDFPPLPVQRSIILRILRYASPHPWGSLRAESNRRSASLDLIARHVWDDGSEDMPRKRFSAGSEVVWTPVVIKSDGTTRIDDGTQPRAEVTARGWLASRQKPNRPQNGESPLGAHSVDLTSLFHSIQESQSREAHSLLFDCRFLIRLKPWLLPIGVRRKICGAGGTVRIVPNGPWFLPMVISHIPGEGDTVLFDGTPGERREEPGLKWIKVQFCRSLEAI